LKTEKRAEAGRNGSQVTLVERFSILPRDEPEAVAVVRRALEREGVTIVEDAAVTQVRGSDGGVSLALEADAVGLRSVSGSHLLVAAGRAPSVEGLGLDDAGVEHDAKGIKVDRRMRTTNRRIFAIGDVAGGPQFTHVAGYHAGIVIRNVLFAMPARVDYRALPWVTYTDPELAHVGLTEAEARAAGEAVSALVEPFSGNDRAQAERRTEGLAKIVLGRRGRILGATLVGPHAGELIGMWGLAIGQKLKLSAVAGMIAPYPTLSEISKRVAGSHFTPTLYGARMRTVVRAIQRMVP
jgi:pyruvate/2-oxoglutarate dehydrogenase complex dihydrolipoamide dehydrogenase (E3) component